MKRRQGFRSISIGNKKFQYAFGSTKFHKPLLIVYTEDDKKHEIDVERTYIPSKPGHRMPTWKGKHAAASGWDSWEAHQLIKAVGLA